ncbi:MAG: protein-glutamate O-methyltransferase CheR [Clostridiales Family XIII bacterium]|jgi:chemotaxis protein methyltransferase CheR|nr:protein-glutamate O-methyltransferase CheR [Clostridiales Family XIII bacterium]
MDALFPTLSDEEFEGFASFIKSHYGVNLESKKNLVESRLGAYVVRRGFQDYAAYFEYAKNDPTQREMSMLVSRVTTSHTYFMRESDHFEFFADEVLPGVMGLGGFDLRVWCAGCASGEEPYALSMYILDRVERLGVSGWDTTLLATDVAEDALKTASAGVYDEGELVSLPDGWMWRFFTPMQDGCWRVSQALRENVAFKRHNLMGDFAFTKPMHAIFCRNVMIYFDADTKTALLRKFYDVLVPGGYLFIGHSESLTALGTGFVYVRPSVYRKPL